MGSNPTTCTTNPLILVSGQILYIRTLKLEVLDNGGNMEVFKGLSDDIEDGRNKARLEEILVWIQRSFPSLSPRIAWNQPTFTDHGTFIISFSPSRNHLSVSFEKAGIDRFSEEILKVGYAQGSMTLRIPWNKPVDYNLLELMIRFNIDDKKDCKTFWRKAGGK